MRVVGRHEVGYDTRMMPAGAGVAWLVIVLCQVVCAVDARWSGLRMSPV